MKRKLQDLLPRFLFLASVATVIFVYGVAVGKYRIFPFSTIKAAMKTAQAIADNSGREAPAPVDSHPDGIDIKRATALKESAFGRPFLVFGGLFDFTDQCLHFGCLAAEYDGDGTIARTYPYRPYEIEKANRTPEFKYEAVEFDFARDAQPVGIERYPDGDLLVTFQNTGTFPFGGGVARVGRDGRPVWYRRDFSHHWPTLTEGGLALVPNLDVGGKTFELNVHGHRIRLECLSGLIYKDKVNVLDGDGEVVREIDLLSQLVDSPFRGVLQHTVHDCDPIHLNYVDEISGPPDGLSGLAPPVRAGDLVVSLRNISAFGIIDGETGRFKHLIRGSFYQQHSVRHLKGTRFLLFDNHGGDLTGGPSRLLAVDIGGGGEKTVFPNSGTPDDLKGLFSHRAGFVDISEDRRRAWVTFTEEGKALEIRLSDGAVLGEFTAMHVNPDSGPSEGETPEPNVHHLYGVAYLRN